MNDKLKLFKNNTPFKDRNDVEWIQEFNEFLQGTLPENIFIPDKDILTLTPNQAYSVLWYLREHFAILPDMFCKCDSCNTIYDDSSEGYYSETGNEIGHNFCSACDHLAPYEED